MRLFLSRVLFVAGLTAFAACGGATPSSPGDLTVSVPLSTPQPPAYVPPSNFRGDATVLSVSNTGGCGWGRSPGETRVGVLWNVSINGTSVILDEDMNNSPTDDVPFKGALDGLRFTATYDQGADYLQWVCQFKGGDLSGMFSADFSTFDAEEVLVWGAGAGETRVTRRWHAIRTAP